MKVYIHYEEEGFPAFTLPIEWTDAKATFDSLKEKFVSSYNQKFKKKILDADCLCIVSEKKKKFNGKSLVSSLLNHGDDVFIVSISASQRELLKETEKSSPEDKENQTQHKHEKKEQGNKEKTQTHKHEKKEQTKEKTEATAILSLVERLLHLAIDSVKKNNYKNAVTIYEQILEVVPNEKTSLFHLGEIFFSAEKYDKAIDYLTKGVKEHPTELEFHLKLGEAFLEKGDFNSAIKWFSSASQLIPSEDTSNMDRIKVLIGKALFGKGEVDAAMQLFVNVLQHNEEHVEALIEYGKTLHRQGKRLDSLRVFLKLLIMKPDDKSVRGNLAAVIQDEDGHGVDLVENELNQAPSVAPALVFLATVIKDYGAVEEAVTLYQHGLQLQPSLASYCLSYVHTLEVCNKYQDAFLSMKEFCHNNSTLSVGTLKCSHVLKVIEDVVDLYDLTSIRSNPPKAPEVTATDSAIQYSQTELDLLALFFTLVKIVFIVGALELIHPLVSIIEAARGKRELHLTNIRNEHAYYCCISQLMEYVSLPIPSVEPLYVAGDSHCLSPAWHSVTFQGKQRLLKPMLVTGLKIWHLRSSSTFFPKNNFYNVLSSVPDGSHIIFLFGEIDCREGLVVSVDKCRYKNLEEGITVTIDIYINVLLNLIKERSFHIYIHPVVPVLNETRHIVKIFNRILKEKVRKIAELHLLDFFDDLLNESGALNPQYELDGTHMNPKYLTALNQSLNRLSLT